MATWSLESFRQREFKEGVEVAERSHSKRQSWGPKTPERLQAESVGDTDGWIPMLSFPVGFCLPRLFG